MHEEEAQVFVEGKEEIAQRLNSSTKSRQKSYEFSSLLFTVTSTALLEILILQTHATSYSFYKGDRRKT